MTVRPTPAKGALRVLRGSGLAITSASLSVAAHAAAGGSLPDPGTTLVITLLLAGAGAALAGRRRGSLSIVGALGVGQLALHVFLQLAGSHQDGMAATGVSLDPVAMTAGHVLAAIFTGLALARAEQALFVVAWVLAMVLPRKPEPLPVVTGQLAVCVPASTVRVLAQLIHQRIHGLRGPPDGVC